MKIRSYKELDAHEFNEEPAMITRFTIHVSRFTIHDPRPTNKGFTLLEVLIALTLFTIGILIIMRLFSAALVSSIDPENTGIATTLAQARIEEMRNLNFDTGIVNEARADAPGFTGFQRSVTVTTPYTDLKQVTVNVYWSYKGGETTTTLVTYISKN